METANLTQADYLPIALAHLSMIAQAANGEYKPRPGEIEQRQAWLVGFLKTGQGLVTDADRECSRAINKVLSQPEPLSTHSDAA